MQIYRFIIICPNFFHTFQKLTGNYLLFFMIIHNFAKVIPNIIDELLHKNIYPLLLNI